jgi:hypothetical protein
VIYKSVHGSRAIQFSVRRQVDTATTHSTQSEAAKFMFRAMQTRSAVSAN